MEFIKLDLIKQYDGGTATSYLRKDEILEIEEPNVVGAGSYIVTKGNRSMYAIQSVSEVLRLLGNKKIK